MSHREFPPLRYFSAIVLIIAALIGCKSRMETAATVGPSMKITIHPAHEGFTRIIDVQVATDQARRIQRVQTTYDGFTLGDDALNPPSSSYARTFKKTEGIAPNQSHTVIVVGWDTEGGSDAGRKTWTD